MDTEALFMASTIAVSMGWSSARAKPGDANAKTARAARSWCFLMEAFC
jgi:hypothetical protein